MTILSSLSKADQKLSGKWWLPLLIFFVTGFVVYFPSLFFDYTYMDDSFLLKDSMSFLSDPSNIFKAFREGVFAHKPDVPDIYYRPLQTVSYMIDIYISGDAMPMYHFMNIFLHLICCSVLYLVLIEYGVSKIYSLIFSLLFLTHPALTGAVSWIPGRVDILLAIFSFSSFLHFLRCLKKPDIINLSGCIVFYTLALFTKETAIILPFIYLLYYLCVLLSSPGTRAKYPVLKIKFQVLFLLSWILIGVFYLYMRNSALPSTSTSLLASELFPNFLRNLPALLLYLGKALLPFHLSVYPTSEDPNLRYGYFAIAILLLVLISVPRERLLFFIFNVLWFFLFLLPSLSSAYAYLPESRLYLPLCGILFLLSEVSPELFFQRISSIIPNARRKMTIENQALFSSKRKQIAFLSIGTSLCILFVFLNFRQSHKYKNDLLFWQHAVDESPSFPLIHMRLGEAFRRNHQNEAAAKEFDIAFDKNPDLPFLRLSMASLYIEQGKLAGAEELLENDPYTKFNYSLYNDIALAYKKEGRMEEAIIRWKKSIDLNPSFMDAYASLSAAYFDQRKYEDAIWICKEIIRKEPSYRNAYNMLIEIYTFQNNPEMADYYRKQHP